MARILLISVLIIPVILAQSVDDQLKKVNNGLAALDQVITAGRKQTAQASVDALNAVSTAFPQLGPIAMLVRLFVSGNVASPNYQVLQKLKELSMKVDRIELKVDQLFDHVEGTAIVLRYKDRIEMISKVRNQYRNYVLNPVTGNKNDLVDKCRQNSMLDVIEWFKEEMVNEYDRNDKRNIALRKFVIRTYNLERFRRWLSSITQAVTEAIVLHIVCVGVKNEGDPDAIDRILHGKKFDVLEGIEFPVVGGDQLIIDEKLYDLKSAFKRAEEELKRDFWNERAIREIEFYMREKEGEGDHQKFATDLHDKLKDMFSWRSWMVASWSGNTVGQDQHWVVTRDYSKFWLRQHGRNLMVGSTTNWNRDTTSEIERCVKVIKDQKNNDHEYKAEAKRFSNKLQECMKDWEAISVVKRGNDFREKRSYSNGFYNGNFWQYNNRGYLSKQDTFSISVIPK